MSNLRNKIIRLAHANPELRKDLLPLITATHSKKANWWNLVSLYEGRDQFRMTIGAEQTYSDAEGSLDYVLKQSLPRVEKDVYKPIVKALQEHPDIQLYSIPKFRTIKGLTKRKSMLIGWTLSGTKPDEMDLGAYLKGLGIRSNWDLK